MASSVSFKGHRRPKPAPRGHFWRPGEFYVPVTIEMTTSPAFRSLPETARCIVLDMIATYWRASAADTAPPRGGFAYTFTGCGVPCSPRTFAASMKAIGDRGWFHRTRSTGPVPHFKPGPWRDYKPTDPLPDVPPHRQQATVKPSKRQSAAQGHFWKPGQVFCPVTTELLHSEAWKALTALARLIALDMVQHYTAISSFDTRTLPDGFKYGINDCTVDTSPRSFYSARAAITETRFFTTPPEIQRDGVIRFLPGDWRAYRAPASAKFREVERVKAAYVAAGQARRTAFLEKGTGNFCGEGTGNFCGEGDPAAA